MKVKILFFTIILNLKLSEASVKSDKNSRNTITPGKWPSTEIPVHIDTFYSERKFLN